MSCKENIDKLVPSLDLLLRILDEEFLEELADDLSKGRAGRDMSPRKAVEMEVRRRRDELLSELPDLIDINDYITIYRAISVDDIKTTKKELSTFHEVTYGGKLSGIGIYWTWDESTAKARDKYWSCPAQGKVLTIVKAEARCIDIDFDETFWTFVTHYEKKEKEIRLPERTKVDITGIYDEHFNFSPFVGWAYT